MLPAAPGSVTGTNIWINHNKNKTLPRILLPKVLEDGPLVPKSHLNRSQGCRRMYPWGRFPPNPSPKVPANVPRAKVVLSRILSIFVFL